MKKLPTLHLINGDATLPAFEAAMLPGQVLVWREILSEGPAVASLPEQEFWKMRQKHIMQTYGETAAAYRKKVLDELPKLNAAGAFFEVVLWFDADLMCQINLLYLLHRLYQLQPTSVSVCTPPLLENISQLEPEPLHALFGKRQPQTDAHLKQAHELWQLYAGPDPKELQRYLQQQSFLQPQVRKAMSLHLSRFPDCTNGLGHPEYAMLQLIQQGAETKEHLIQQFWKQYPDYGFGDWQILEMLKRMQPELVHLEEKLTLSPLGRQVIQGLNKFSPVALWLGGIRIDKDNYLCFNHITKQLQFSS